MLPNLSFALLVIGFCAVSGQGTGHLPICTVALQGRHFPSGFDCQSYHTCFNEVWILQECPVGWWFQRVQEVCARPLDVWDCEFAPETQPPPTTEPPPQPTTVFPPPPPTTVTPPSPDSQCPPSGVSKLINPYSCTRYFMCFDGWQVERTCSPGLYFSRSQLRCVRRADSDCLIDGESCPAENDPNNIVFLPDQEDCQRYFVCHDGAPVEFDCGPTLHWEPNRNWCIREEESDCEPSYPLPEVREIECPEDTESDVIFLPHPEDCQFYFICLDGTSTLARCARNTLFDYIRGNCFFAQSARCFN